MAISVPRLLKVLRAGYRGRVWAWTGRDEFEVIAGAILTQRTSWNNVRIALENLRSSGNLSQESILSLGEARVRKYIRPAGFYKQKSEYLVNIVEYMRDRYQSDISRMRRTPTGQLREELLALRGIGPETADAILLYALGKPSFVVDAYTYRLMWRLGRSIGKDYDTAKSVFEKAMKGNARDYADMHSLIVIHSKERCRKVPICDSCPLYRPCVSKGRY